MARFGLFFCAWVAAGLASVAGAAAAQDVANRPVPGLKSVPAAATPAPFATDAAASDGVRAIEFRAADEMAPADRRFAADAEASIAEQAILSGFDIRQGTWNYRQVVCPALPGHLFLQYARNNGGGDLTVFSASVPRNGAGKVRIIPIRRRGYSLFSPAPVNALTISAFNHIRAEEPEAQRARNWLGNGLCYAALAGGRPRIPGSGTEPVPGQPVSTPSAVLDVKSDGSEVIRFADEAATPHPAAWAMTFTRGGKLVRVTHAPIRSYAEKPVPESGAENALKPVPPAR